MEQLKGSIFITPKDIQIINDCSIRSAQEDHRAVRDSLKITNGKLSVKQYCDYYGLDYDLIVFHLNPFR